jgi:uncharacterized repeat protein (TIGR03803 family)
MSATLTTLVSFTGGNGEEPKRDLIADANGDLFGTTSCDGANGDGTVFEIAKAAGGYASIPTMLVSFNGESPVAGLLADAHGDRFGRPRTAALTLRDSVRNGQSGRHRPLGLQRQGFSSMDRDPSGTLLAF